MGKSFNKSNVLKVLVLVIIAMISFFYFSKLFSSVDIHTASIEYLDDKKMTVAALTVTVSGTAALLSLLPGDALSPIATQLAGMTNWLLLITVVVIMEKYLLTITGFISFGILIPISCGLYIVYIIWKSLFCRSLAIKLAVFGLSIFLIVPTSVQLCKIIEQTNRDSINQSMEVLSKDEDTENTETNEDNDVNKQSIIDKLVGIVEAIKNSTTEIASGVTEKIEEAKTAISNFIDAIAVLVVTSCVIPLLVILGYSLLIKMIFGIHLDPPKKLLNRLNIGKENSDISE
jgi:hypothetical protein